MNEVDALELVRAAIWTVIVAAGPAVGAAMAVGIVIELLLFNPLEKRLLRGRGLLRS